ncbi:MAG: alpha/beta fold hydrolase [Janthinobacterium lividum]
MSKFKISCVNLRLVGMLVWIFSTISLTHASYQMMTTPDGAKLRVAHWQSTVSQGQPVTVVLLQGRSSYIEKFEEFIQDLQKRGYDVWTFDWRGSGGSSRLIADNSQKVHIDSYDTYLKDLDDIIKKVIEPQTTKPLVFVGISMGGHLALRHIQQKFNQVAGALVLAPMIAINSNPYPNWLARLIVSTATSLGMGQNYVIGYGDYKMNQPINPKKLGTTDLARYRRQLDINKTHMSFVTAGPTYQWVHESFKSLDRLHRSTEISKISVPLTLIKAEDDFVVDTSQDEAFCKKIPQCQIKTYAKSRHNILIEIDAIRDRVFQDLDELVKRVTRIKLQNKAAA